MAVNVPLTFRIYKGDELVREEVLTQSVIKVGKLSSSHLRLDDDTVSRMHAVIEVTGPGDVSIIDLGSTKGTIVNGQKVNKATLQDGDMIQLGATRIELSIGEPVDDMEDAPTRVQDSPVAVATSNSPHDVVSSVPHPSIGGPAAPSPVAAPAPAPVAPPPGLGAPPPRMAPAPMAMAPMAMAPAAPPVYGGPAAAHPGLGPGIVDDIGGGQAIEVAAMLDDSVVAVKHVMNPRGGHVTPATYLMFGIGAAFLVMSAIGFGAGVKNAKFNKIAEHEWIEVQRKPLHDFRPRRISLAYDWMAFGGLSGGLVLLTWGLIRLRDEREQPYFRIGTDANVEFPTSDSPAPSFPLVAPAGDDFVLNLAHGMQGEMLDDAGTASPLTVQQTTIPFKSRFRVRTGKNTFMISSVPRPRRQVVPLLATVETTMLAYLGGTSVIIFGFLILLLNMPPSPETLSFDSLHGDGVFARLQSAPPEEPKVEETENEDDEGDDKSGGTGTKMALEEGKMGKKDSTRQSGQYAMKKTYDGDPQLARQQAMDAARSAGVLGAFSASQGGAFASITGTGDFSSGLDDRDVYGGLIGNEVGEMQGGWGYGLKGTGPGGGGTGWGTIGTGRYGTIGHGSGTGSGYGVGSGSGGMRGRKSRPPRISIGHASAVGDLDKNIIRRYIRKKMQQYKYCYEKQLVVKPKLAGTVVTNFTISGNGAVLSVSAGGMGDSTVENCVASVIKSIQFPKPKNGGMVNVRYPFTFQPAGE